MSELPDWDTLKVGVGCPLCYPRPDYSEYLFLIRKLTVSSLYLQRNQAYQGMAALIYDDRHVTRINELSRDEWKRFSEDLWVAENALSRALKPDHMNVESLGNGVPHIHWHIIPRWKEDDRWGGPIWVTDQEDFPDARLREDTYRELADRINDAIDGPHSTTG